MADKVESVFDCLCHIFSIPIEDKRRKRKTRYEVKGRIAIIEQYGTRSWEGHWDDDHSTTYIGSTKKEVKFDMGVI